MDYSELTQKIKIDQKIWENFPNYKCLILIVSNLSNQSSNEYSDNLLSKSEKFILELLSQKSLDDLEELSHWRQVYLSFGIKPRAARSSVEALVRRCEKGLPRIDLLTDLYNSLSLKYLLPIGGENLDNYVGIPHLTISEGNELFETIDNGQMVSVNPDPGEIIWKDDLGVTCRRWNWRQCNRTRLDLDTKNAIFIIDCLSLDADKKLTELKNEITKELNLLFPQAKIISQIYQA